MKTLPIIAALIFASAARGQVLLDFSWSSFNGNSSALIPDHNATGVSDTRSLISDLKDILHVDVWVQTDSGFNGDLYLSLQHGSTTAVLLNRPGRDQSNHFGYDDAGFNVTFRDNAANGDIHTYQNVFIPAPGSPLTGIWQPDGRTADPSLSLTTSSRSAFLAAFNGQNINGDWTLFAADLSSGGEAQITAWGMIVTVVPEPRDTCLAVAVLVGIFGFLRHGERRR